jgi:2-succinyl-5-enolpyruvyl-6-hydroxy-3-cyclohexene-1-carboxylate synthase
MKHRIINLITGYCHHYGASCAVISPGSRSAPLALAFLRNEKYRCFFSNDERSAAYMALGLAQSSESPVVLICTSGTAAANFYPAVCEAFNQRIPLLVISADRPPNAYLNFENQSICQTALYGNNITGELHIDLSTKILDENSLKRALSELLHNALRINKGPLHLNVLLDDQLYPEKGIGYDSVDIADSEEEAACQQKKTIDLALPSDVKRVLIIGAMGAPDEELKNILTKLLAANALLFHPDINSNLYGLPNSIVLAGKTFEQLPTDMFPDLVLSFGTYLLDTKLKDVLKANPPKYHWHIDIRGTEPDFFGMRSRNIRITARDFFFYFSELQGIGQLDAEFVVRCMETDRGLWEKNLTITQDADKEMFFLKHILRKLSGNCVLHLGNSSPVRLVSELGGIIHEEKNALEIFSNRGCSGIDGSLSTALGHALADQREQVLILGDLSFQYDCNALWFDALPGNLKVIVLNNFGGGIFRRINGPAQQAEFEVCFLRPHRMDFKNLCRHFNVDYDCVTQFQHLSPALNDLFNSSKMRILEIEIR